MPKQAPVKAKASQQADDRKLHDLLQAVESRCPFGPRFFANQLGGLIRDRCPDPTEVRPVVEVHVHNGEVLDVCHIIGLAPAYAALAVYGAPPRSTPRPMRTELVPYTSIARVAILSSAMEGQHVGFDAQHDTVVLVARMGQDSAEVLMQLAATPVG